MTIPTLVKSVALADLDLSLKLLKKSLKNVPKTSEELELHVDDIDSLVWYVSNGILRERVGSRRVLEKIIPLCTKALEFVRGYEKNNTPEIIHSQVMYKRLVWMQKYAIGEEGVN